VNVVAEDLMLRAVLAVACTPPDELAGRAGLGEAAAAECDAMEREQIYIESG